MGNGIVDFCWFFFHLDIEQSFDMLKKSFHLKLKATLPCLNRIEFNQFDSDYFYSKHTHTHTHIS